MSPHVDPFVKIAFDWHTHQYWCVAPDGVKCTLSSPHIFWARFRWPDGTETVSVIERWWGWASGVRYLFVRENFRGVSVEIPLEGKYLSPSTIASTREESEEAHRMWLAAQAETEDANAHQAV